MALINALIAFSHGELFVGLSRTDKVYAIIIGYKEKKNVFYSTGNPAKGVIPIVRSKARRNASVYIVKVRKIP